MHFKLGLYEHQSAGALEALLSLIHEKKFIQCGKPEIIKQIVIITYEPAFGIIGDPAKKNPLNRQSADHSMVYITSTLLRKAFEDQKFAEKLAACANLSDVWKLLMLEPIDYSHPAIFNKTTRLLMEKTVF
jgi:2-methylcitrate dehydratase